MEVFSTKWATILLQSLYARTVKPVCTYVCPILIHQLSKRTSTQRSTQRSVHWCIIEMPETYYTTVLRMIWRQNHSWSVIAVSRIWERWPDFLKVMGMTTRAFETNMVANIDGHFSYLSSCLVTCFATAPLDGISQSTQGTIPPLSSISLEEECLELPQNR